MSSQDVAQEGQEISRRDGRNHLGGGSVDTVTSVGVKQGALPEEVERQTDILPLSPNHRSNRSPDRVKREAGVSRQHSQVERHGVFQGVDRARIVIREAARSPVSSSRAFSPPSSQNINRNGQSADLILEMMTLVRPRGETSQQVLERFVP